MVSPKPVETSETVPVKKEKKKKVYRGETVADRIIASAKRYEQLRLLENSAKKTEPDATTPSPATEQPTNTETVVKSKSKMDNLTQPTSEIDDLSALEWETSSEQSGL